MSDYQAVVGSHILEIPAGFTFDLASVPRPFWFLITPYHLSIPAPLIHDWLYRSRGCFRCRGGRRVCFRRSEADRHFFRLMRAEGVHLLIASAAWLVVRAVGWLWWRPFEEDSRAESRAVENLVPENRLARDTSSGQGEIPDRRYGV